MTSLTFIMPVRHPQSVRDPADQQRVIGQTIRSIAAQTVDDWRLRIVCNREQRLPPLPANVERVDIDLPPVPREALESATDMASTYIPANLDRGRRVHLGLAGLGPDDLIMPVDDDDFISRRLAEHVLARAAAGGSAWLLGPGYVFPDGGFWMRPASVDCYRFTGTSVIARLRRFPGLADAAPSEEAVHDIGDHGRSSSRLLTGDDPAEIVPFPAVVYRVNHGNQVQVDVARFIPDGERVGILPRRRSANPVKDLVHRLRFAARERPLHPLLCREFFGGLTPPRGPDRDRRGSATQAAR
ncbi:MAG: hypothetical protein AAF676_00350 [Pseudomonadota bacterium]